MSRRGSAVGLSACRAAVFSLSAVAALGANSSLWRRPNTTMGMALPAARSAGGTAAAPRLPYLYGTAWKKEATVELVVQAVRAGFRGIDTACQPKHYREDLVGEALALLAREGGPRRDELWLQTKFTPLRGQDPDNVPYDKGAPLGTQVEQSIAKSLQNLRTSRIDSLLLHSPLSLEQTLEVWAAFERAVDHGVVGQLGISNCYDFEFFQSLYQAARVKPAVLQNRFYADSGYDARLRAFCLERGVVYQTFWTLTANPHVLRAAPVRRAAERLRATEQQVLFRWLIQAGHQPLTGTKSREHMLQDLSAASLELTQAEMAEIGALFH
mmetsp:Transcript_42291/g.111856  ORF Transcript_42291/g.111856 Transcript_42291/m.111856 type:complete len:326 (+) Transcript_42291:23-1000(+)